MTEKSSAYTNQSRGTSSEDGGEKNEEEDFDFTGFVNNTVSGYRRGE